MPLPGCCTEKGWLSHLARIANSTKEHKLTLLWPNSKNLSKTSSNQALQFVFQHPAASKSQHPAANTLGNTWPTIFHHAKNLVITIWQSSHHFVTLRSCSHQPEHSPLSQLHVGSSNIFTKNYQNTTSFHHHSFIWTAFGAPLNLHSPTVKPILVLFLQGMSMADFELKWIRAVWTDFLQAFITINHHWQLFLLAISKEALHPFFFTTK